MQKRFDVGSRRWEELKILSIVYVYLASGSPHHYQVGLGTRGRISTFHGAGESLSLSSFHLLCLLWSTLSYHKDRTDSRLLITVSQPKICKEQRRGDSRTALALEEDWRTAWQSVNKMVFFLCQACSLLKAFLLPLEALFSLPFSHPAKVTLQPYTHFNLWSGKRNPSAPPLLAACAGLWQPLTLPMLGAGLA